MSTSIDGRQKMKIGDFGRVRSFFPLMGGRSLMVLAFSVLLDGCSDMSVGSQPLDRSIDVLDLARRRGLDEVVCQEALQSLLTVVQVVDDELLAHARDEALARIRDPEDWPTLALCLQLECAVWTEDQDFFGSGVATWTCATVERYLRC